MRVRMAPLAAELRVDPKDMVMRTNDRTSQAGHDGELLARARRQWQLGDWDSLAELNPDTLQEHPDRANLALLAATAHAQLGNMARSRQLAEQSLDWGQPKRLVGRFLIAGVHDSLGRAIALRENTQRALEHFEKALHTGTPEADPSVLAPIRAANQVRKRRAMAPAGNDEADRALDDYADRLVQTCLNNADLYAATDQVFDDKSLPSEIHSLFLLKLAENFASRNDKLIATHYLRQGRHYFDDAPAATQIRLLNLLVRIGRVDDAADIVMNRALQGLPAVELDSATTKAIRDSYEQVRAALGKRSEHGHDLLLDWLKSNLSKLPPIDSERVLIEIGTTREDVPGQGSTAKIAKFCANHGLKFITVDMDPHNSHMAQIFFERHKFPFSAVTHKGEDFLRQYQGRMDFVFLDAYDFDHGKHSELRQSRYMRFLGDRIDEQACHQMHLDCAESVLQKLAPDGVVCIDDTWLDDVNRWTAKGTLAMPYLLENGFALIEARNRAALLRPPVRDA